MICKSNSVRVSKDNMDSTKILMSTKTDYFEGENGLKRYAKFSTDRWPINSL